MPKFLCLIATEDRLWNVKRALRNLDGRSGIAGQCFSVFEVCNRPERYSEMMKTAEDCDFAVVYFHGGAQVLPDFKGFWNRLTARMPVFFQSSLPDEIAELMPSSGLSVEAYRGISGYFAHADESNTQAMFLYIAATLLGADCDYPRPKPPILEGLYLPGGALDEVAEGAYLENAEATDKPVIGLILHQNNILNQNTRHIDALISKLEELGAYPLPIFTRMARDEDDSCGIVHAMERLFSRGGKRLPECVIVATGFALTLLGNPGDGRQKEIQSIFQTWDVPVLQAPITHFTAEDYREKPQGIDGMSLATSVFQPELDGQIMTVACATEETAVADGVERRVAVPIPDRVERVCRTAMGWVNLRRLPNRQKKIAILFHNTPGNDKIGCAEGLDTFESVRRILQTLEQEGCALDYTFRDSQAIINALTDALTNDTRWLSTEKMAELAFDRVSPETYRKWFANLREDVRDNLALNWGEPPGAVMAHEDELLIPGIQNGNVFIGLQPSRAFGEQAASLYHSTDFPPPYSYIAYYRWIEEVFRADLILHVGTHGSLEWLPGKETGLSQACYPDICLGSVPHLYIYHIGITGEGVQAKRRSSAVILDHLPPSMQEAKAYDKLSDLDEAFKQYYHAKQARPAQLPELARRVHDLALKADLLSELGIDEAKWESRPEECLGALHLWLGELKNSAVRDGLHIFGFAPEGELFDNLARMLMRVPNGPVPALNDSALAAMGYEPEAVRDCPNALFGGKTGLELFDEATALARELTGRLSAAGYAPDAVEDAVRFAKEKYLGDPLPLREALDYMCRTVKSKIDRTADEMKYLVRGLNGRFVPPGPGGNPTRGNVSILPTGRNFTAGDPTEIPSRAAWDIGQSLAQKALDHYMKEEGGYPESVAMVVWAGGVLKTCGEDLAEIFCLMGARPVYLGQTTRVIGVEPIPMDELGRPRIDVTLRVSGLFRDMYPNLIRLMDEAVACIAALDEDESVNFVKKHVNAEMRALADKGLPFQEAEDQARIRVFGCAPGAYGAGVSHLIETRLWETVEDIATVYENHSSHAYGSKFHGQKLPDLFRRRLAQATMTIKNESSVETDMLDSDDFYAYHGGLIASVRRNSGKAPIALTGHSDDPERPTVRDVVLETARIMRTRVLNPIWLEGLKRHGFKGAQEISAAVDAFFGWDATAEAGRDWMYEEIAQRYLLDEKTREWMESVNRWAVHALSERLLEAEKRGMWKAEPKTLDEVTRIYMRAEGLIEEGLK